MRRAGAFTYSDELYHYGILGMKWGIRRWQNEDGTLTDEGRSRYGKQTDIKDAWKDLRTKEKSNARKYKVANVASGGLLGTSMVSGAAALTPDLTIAAVSGGISIVSAVAGIKLDDVSGKLRHRADEIVKKYNDVKMGEIKIPKGTELIRTSLTQKENKNRRMYTSYGEEKGLDPYYENTWPEMLRTISGNPNAKVYRNTYEVKTDIIAPSYEKRVKAAEAVLNANRKTMEEFGKAYAMDQMRITFNDFSANSIDDIVKTERKRNDIRAIEGLNIKKSYNEMAKETVDKIIDKETKRADLSNPDNFAKFTASIPKSDKLMNAYIKELKKQGYNAVYDDNSLSRAPFIVFDPKDLNMVDSEEIAKLNK